MKEKERAVEVLKEIEREAQKKRKERFEMIKRSIRNHSVERATLIYSIWEAEPYEAMMFDVKNGLKLKIMRTEKREGICGVGSGCTVF